MPHCHMISLNHPSGSLSISWTRILTQTRKRLCRGPLKPQDRDESEGGKNNNACDAHVKVVEPKEMEKEIYQSTDCKVWLNPDFSRFH